MDRWWRGGWRGVVVVGGWGGAHPHPAHTPHTPLTRSARRARPPPTRPRPTRSARARRPPCRTLDAAEPCCAVEWRIAFARERGLWSKGVSRTQRHLSPHNVSPVYVRLLRDLSAGSVRPPAHETPAQDEGRARARAHAATAIAPGLQQRLHAEAEHVPHKRGAVRPWALSPVSGGLSQLTHTRFAL